MDKGLKFIKKVRSFLLGKEEKFRNQKAKQIHAEAYHLDKVWDRVKDYPRSKQVTWYIMTPANYGYIHNFVGANLSKKELDKVLSKRAKWMRENGYKVELHVHFWKHAVMPTDQKRVMLQEAREWGKKNGLEFTELVPGWWAKDPDIPQVCRELGLNLAKRELSTHDYNL